MNIIFHHPLPLDPDAKSASGIRPQRMLQAFKDLGYKVDIVAGYGVERSAAIKKIKKNILSGVRYDFVYAESSTMPTILTERHHMPTHPLMDWRFFSLLKRKNIPIGLFYRDIYWVFDNYGKGLNSFKSNFAKMAYYFDLWVYEKTLSKLYLPSLKMGDYVPIVSEYKFSALPPGHENTIVEKKSIKNIIKLFYVGGMSNHYQLHLLFEVLKDFSEIEFTLCTRDAEWFSVKDEYTKVAGNVNIIHKSGAEMKNYLQDCDIAILYVKPQEYWEFASPVKLYEYLGFQKPILASSGTLAGDFVEENKIGWSIPYEKSSIIEFFNKIVSDKNIINSVQNNLPAVAAKHSWLARAQQVATELTAP